MPDVLVATDTKYKIVYNPGTNNATQFVVHGTGLTYTSSGDPAILLPTGGVASSISVKFNTGFDEFVLGHVKVTQLTISNITDMLSAGLDFSSDYGMSNIGGILAGSKIKIIEGGGDYYGSGGDDLVYGNSGSNTFDGDWGDDTLYGGKGRDTFYSFTGSDTLFGGKGNDHFFIDVWDDDDPQTTWAYGGDGADYLSSDDTTAHLYGGNGNDTLENTGPLSTLFGDKGHDTLSTYYGVNIAYGGRGNDTFDGGTGSGQGTDHLFGGSGADTFNFGRRDVVTGGGGADVFIFDLATDLDKAVVKDFDLSKDHIQMVNAGLTTAADGFAEFGAHAADVVAGVKYVSGGDTIILKGVSLADLTVDHFI